LLLAACSREIPVEHGAPIDVLFCERDNCTTALANLLTGASEAKCALYDVSIPEIVKALEHAAWVTNDGKGPLMHNKFCVINKSTVWTGSWNPTRGKKANNAVIVHSAALARNYLDEFSELPGGKRRVRFPNIMFNGYLLENYFCPEDDCKRHVLEKLKAAKKSIVFMLASFTDNDVLALLKEKGKALEVHGIVDKSQKKAISALGNVKAGNVHHKVFVIDGETVITGSYNPTSNGNRRNDENILIVHDASIAQKYLDEYLTLSVGAS
jgi:phosphatidylserine/phosphatidylglycerophosphate/cardiolipin synthase-like enzyme